MFRLTTLFAILFLAGCAGANLPAGHPASIEPLLDRQVPGERFVAEGLAPQEIDPASRLASALTRHEEICESTGCPEWKAHIAAMKERIGESDASAIAWKVHLAFKKYSSSPVLAEHQYGQNYFASPAEFLAAGKRGDLKAIALAEFMTLYELGWDTSRLHYAVVLTNGEYVPVTVVSDPEWKNDTEFFLLYERERPDDLFPRSAEKPKFVYATDGKHLWSPLNFSKRISSTASLASNS